MQPNELTFGEIQEGQRATADYEITPAVYEHFLGAFGDRSPIHVEEAYARERGFSGRVMHGSILNGFVSHFVGMRFPGRRALLVSTDMRFRHPCYLHEKLRLEASVAQKVEGLHTLVLHVTFHSLSQEKKVANAIVTVKVADA